MPVWPSWDGSCIMHVNGVEAHHYIVTQWRIQDFLKEVSVVTVAREARAKFLKPRPF